MDLDDSSSDCEIIDSIEIVKQEPPGSPEPSKNINIGDVSTAGNNQEDEAMISYVPQTDNPPPDIDIKTEKSPLFSDVEPSETPKVPEVPKEIEASKSLESSTKNSEVNSTDEKTSPKIPENSPKVPETEPVPQIQAIPIKELITPVTIKQEPKEKSPPPPSQPLSSKDVNFGASTSQCFPPTKIKQSPPSSPPPEKPPASNPKLKVEPIEIDPGSVGVAPQYINLDDFTMDKKRKRGYCDPLENPSKVPKIEPSKYHKHYTSRDILCTRPSAMVKSKVGEDKEFEQIILTTNYFNVIKKAKFEMVQYNIDFDPEVLTISLKKTLIREQKPLIGGYIFDGCNVFTMKRLTTTEYTSSDREGKKYKITLNIENIIPMSNQTSIQLLNIILRKSMEGLKLQQVGKNFYDAENKVSIRDYRLELWPGYVTSIRQHERNILLCAEIAHKVMRNESMLDILEQLKREVTEYRTEYVRRVVGKVVLTDYNNQTYRIDAVDFESCPASTFETKRGPEAYMTYYYRKHQIRIQDRKQPLLISKSRTRDIKNGQSELIALIPELCRATGFTDEMRTNFKLMKCVSEYTRLTPYTYKQRLLLFNKRLHSTQESVGEFENFNLELDKNLVEVIGHVCPRTLIKMGNGEVEQASETSEWTNAFRSKSMFYMKNLTNWVLIVPRAFENDTRNFVKMLQNSSRGMQYIISDPRWIILINDRVETYIKATDDAITLDPMLIFYVSSQNRPERYTAIKRKCSINHSIATQVVLSRTIRPKDGRNSGLMSIATKVAIQINCKLGGAPWLINIPLSGLMTIGFDVYQDAKDTGKMYGALVATMDLKEESTRYAKFFSTVSAFRSPEQCSNEMSINVNKALHEFCRQHGNLPQRILFYRDGYADSQIENIYKYELKQLKKTLENTYGCVKLSPPKLAYVLVNKKMSAKFFFNDTNVKPGTIVDDVLTLPERYDFYLVSQSVRQGTASPTSYNIIEDTLRIGAAKMQMLTYRFTHLYYNWTGTIRVPAVCHYAHKLCYLVGQFLHQAPCGMEKQLYYL